LGRAFRQDKLVFFGACRSLAQVKAFSAFLRTLFREDWVVHAKKPFGGGTTVASESPLVQNAFD
jgi:hypothetical protein